jgi:1,4-alpha-glucan branching enzyme
MKKISLILIAVMAHCMLSAQFAGIQNNQEQPLAAGFKPASTNTFLSQYPAVNAETRQATFRVVAPYAQNVALQLGGKHSMTKDDKGVWWYTTEPLVVGFHYYAVMIDSVR